MVRRPDVGLIRTVSKTQISLKMRDRLRQYGDRVAQALFDLATLGVFLLLARFLVACLAGELAGGKGGRAAVVLLFVLGLCFTFAPALYLVARMRKFYRWFKGDKTASRTLANR